MSEFKIDTGDLRMANLQLLKENLAYNHVLGEMLLPIYCQLMKKDEKEATAYFESRYKKGLEEIDNYIKAEFGQLDISDILQEDKG